MDSLQLGPSIHPPSPCPTLSLAQPPPSRGLLSYLIATRRIRGCAKCLWSCGRATSCAGGPPANRQALFPKGPRTPGTRWWPVERSALLILYPTKTKRLGPGFTLFLPRFDPDGTYHPFLPHFYPVFTPF